MKALLTIIILAVIAWALYAFINNDEVITETRSNNEAQVYVTPAVNQNNSTSTAGTSTGTATTSVKEFTVNGNNFVFNPSNMTVNKGDRVRIIFKNTGGSHDWVIDEFGARTSILASGQSQTIEFTADKAGSFEYYCSVGSHRQMGMKGTLTVK